MNKRFLQIVMLTSLCGTAFAAVGAELVIVGNPAAAPLTKDQAADIFLGKSQAMTPVDQGESSPIRADFYKRVTGRDLAQVKSVWSRLMFSGKGQPPAEVADSSAVKKAVVANPKAVGYIEQSAVDASVKVLLTVE